MLILRGKITQESFILTEIYWIFPLGVFIVCGYLEPQLTAYKIFFGFSVEITKEKRKIITIRN